MVKVSVVIPVYNAEKYLKRCLDSVINQTFRDIEVICVNDGSLDGSARILEEYARLDSRVIVLNQENSGQGAARNNGLKIARGEYIGFVDSDDWIDLDFFEKLYAAAKKYDADAACAGIIRPHANGKNSIKLKFEKEELLSTAIEKYAKNNMPRQCYAWNKIYKKSEIDRQNAKFKEKVLFEDIYFIIRFMYFSHLVVTVPKTNYNYWVNVNSVTRDMRDKNRRDLIAARLDLIKFSRDRHLIFDEKYYIKQKITYKFLGIPILKVHKWETLNKYYLFGAIPFFEKRISL